MTTPYENKIIALLKFCLFIKFIKRNRQKDEDSFGSVSDLENDTRNQRPKR